MAHRDCGAPAAFGARALITWVSVVKSRAKQSANRGEPAAKLVQAVDWVYLFLVQKTWLWVCGAALGAGVVGAVLAAGPLARRVAEQKAAARGIELRAGDLAVGWFNVELRDVQLRLEGVPSVQATLDHVLVHLTPGGALSQIVVRGGQVHVKGSLAEVRKQLNEYRARHASAPSNAAPTARSRVEIVHDLNVRWQDALPHAPDQVIAGLHLERTPERMRMGADLLELNLDQLRAQLAGLSLETSQAAWNQGLVQKLGASEARLSWLGTDTDAQVSAPPPQKKQPDPPPTLSDLLVAHPERTARIVWALDLLRTKLLPRLPESSQIDRLWLSYTRGADRLEVGPNRLTTAKSAHQLLMELVPKEQVSGTPLELSLRMPTEPAGQDEAAVSVKIHGGPVALSTLGLRDGPFGLREVARTFLSGSGEVRLSADARSVSATGHVSLDGLTLDNRALAEQLVVFPHLVMRGRGAFSTDGTEVSAEDCELSLGEARFLGELKLKRSAEALHVKGRVAAPLVSCQALVDSAPRGLLGPVEAMKLSGTMSLQSSVDLDTSALGKMQVHFDFENACKATQVPAVLDPEQFRESFVREVNGAGDFPMKVQLGPNSPGWVSYDDVSPYVEAALLVSEDGRFFRHDGFDDRAIESAISDNAKAGRFVRGASTISMQLAKNLYLSRDKTLSRKFQEAALTSLLEQSFEKKELLELYVNVVEFGPGIYGIGPAAEYYFNTTPGELTLAQAFFLGSILPNPKREFFGQDGLIKPATFQYVQRLLEIAKQRGRLSDEQLATALAEELRFGEASTTPALPATPAPEHADVPADADLTRDENERPAQPLAPRRGIEL